MGIEPVHADTACAVVRQPNQASIAAAANCSMRLIGVPDSSAWTTVLPPRSPCTRIKNMSFTEARCPRRARQTFAVASTPSAVKTAAK